MPDDLGVNLGVNSYMSYFIKKTNETNKQGNGTNDECSYIKWYQGSLKAVDCLIKHINMNLPGVTFHNVLHLEAQRDSMTAALYKHLASFPLKSLDNEKGQMIYV